MVYNLDFFQYSLMLNLARKNVFLKYFHNTILML
uniref:Uncharacterized protein n=1 Tax=Anguilla anguilla TaxID=7936 RepID=A0A0E9XDM6_ANGAN